MYTVRTQIDAQGKCSSSFERLHLVLALLFLKWVIDTKKSDHAHSDPDFGKKDTHSQGYLANNAPQSKKEANKTY